MSATSFVNRLLAPLSGTAVTVAGWLLIAPFALLIPRRQQSVVFFGRDNGKFIDNCKHLFASLHDRNRCDIDSVYLARDDKLCSELRNFGARAVRIGTWSAFWMWLRAGTIVVDSTDWMHGIRFPASRRARIVQLWHGIPLKRIQIAQFELRVRQMPHLKAALLRMYCKVTGRFPKYSMLLSTSHHVSDRAFNQSFRCEHVSFAGYPRNDVLFAQRSALAELGVDRRAQASIAAHRADPYNGPIGVYAPTFRDSMSDPFAEGQIDLPTISGAAMHLRMLLLVKLHPWMHGRLKTSDLPGILFVEPESDAYPLLREADFLITDYSSIYFDYLLLDRPIIFFPYDLDNYLRSERSMYFDYDEMTPGPKATSAGMLVGELEGISAGIDAWKGDRARVRELVFDYQDGNASDRLLAELFEPRYGSSGRPADLKRSSH